MLFQFWIFVFNWNGIFTQFLTIPADPKRLQAILSQQFGGGDFR